MMKFNALLNLKWYEESFNVYDDLTEYSQGRLDLLIKEMNQNPSMRIRVHAHADTQGNADYNQTLSTRRAQTVINYLTSKGIDNARFEIASHGSSKPVNSGENGQLQNRRIEFEVIQK